MTLSSGGSFKRSYPRRSFSRTVGVLFKGDYFLAQASEIGEGGISITGDVVLTEGEPLMVSFQIPNGAFVCLRATVRSTQKIVQDSATMVAHGLAFTQVEFIIKRQIRSYVSSRSN